MQPSLPIPTDNIYKFSCLFGLTLIVVAIFSYASVYSASLDRSIKYLEVVIPLEANKSRSPVEEETLKLNKRLLDVTKTNKDFTLTALAAVLGVGLGISGIGGYHWYTKIQLRDDKLAELQLRKLEFEVDKLKPSPEENSA
jgi:hypothetical protein